MAHQDHAAPAGFRWIYCKCFKHWRTGKPVYRKDGGSFRFLARIR